MNRIRTYFLQELQINNHIDLQKSQDSHKTPHAYRKITVYEHKHPKL